MSATHHAHPGEILLEEFLKPMGVSQYRLAKDIGVDPARINAIVHGKRGITPATAVRLSRYFSMSERFWINAQAHYDLEIEKALHAEEINAIRPVQARVRGLSLGAYVDQVMREHLAAPARAAEQVDIPVASAGGLRAGIDPSSTRALYEVIDAADERPQ